MPSTTVQGEFLPNTLKTIDDEASPRRQSYQDPECPKNFETIGSCAFANTNLSTITLDADNKNFILKDGVLYTKDYKYITTGSTQRSQDLPGGKYAPR